MPRDTIFQMKFSSVFPLDKYFENQNTRRYLSL